MSSLCTKEVAGWHVEHSVFIKLSNLYHQTQVTETYQPLICTNPYIKKAWFSLQCLHQLKYIG